MRRKVGGEEEMEEVFIYSKGTMIHDCTRRDNNSESKEKGKRGKSISISLPKN